MHQYSEEAVRRTLEPFHGRIWRVFQRGYADWLKIKELMSHHQMGPIIYPRTATNHIFDAIAQHAIKEFASAPSVSVRAESQTVKFCFRDKVVARFKKGNQDHLGQNHPTQAVMRFIDPQLVLPDFPPEAAKVDITWTSTILEDAIEELCVVARDRDIRRWFYPIRAPSHRTNLVSQFSKPSHERVDSQPLVVIKSRDRIIDSGD